MYSNIQHLGDSYKYSHPECYPKNMIGSHFYYEARSSKTYPKIVFFGLQYYLHLLSSGYLMEDLNRTVELALKHGIPFDISAWNYLERLRYLPVRITAKPEGSICDIHEPLFTVESTDSHVAWLPGFLETLLSKVWYPCTVATKAWKTKQMLLQYGPKEWADFAYHNFGDRGSSSVESAVLGGMAHMLFFKGTDNFNAVAHINNGYLSIPSHYEINDVYASSIPATEHSVMTAYGKEGERQAILNFVTQHAGKYRMFACVLDSYDVKAAVEYCTCITYPVRGCLETSKSILVLRPDSGDPLTVIKDILGIIGRNECAYTTENGLHLFTNYRILWGDGITPDVIEQILQSTKAWGFSPRNFAFGSGGDLMQNCNRDTLGFAYKLSAVQVSKNPDNSLSETVWRGVCKDPITDPSKKSKSGLQKINEGVVVYENGKMLKEYSFEEVRKNAEV